MNTNSQSPPGAQPGGFTKEAIRAVYSKPRTGAGFPQLVRELKSIGVVSYDHVIETGANVFHSRTGESATLEKMGPAHPVSPKPDLERLKQIISEHQRGKSDYPTLCGLVAKAGVEKWVCDLVAMTCSYFDKAGNKMHVEMIPTGEYEND